ncbi:MULTISPECIES: hypothetical protein [Pseudomonas]|nr:MULTISPECIES: hypothetical protein [Pseudomonas]
MDYDAASGTGRLVIVDWYAPVPGTVIELQIGSPPEDLVDPDN